MVLVFPQAKKMKHSGYLLSPGDMFQVDPEQVMFATGAPKLTAQSVAPVRSTEDGDEMQEAKAASEPVEEKEDEGGGSTILSPKHHGLQSSCRSHD